MVRISLTLMYTPYYNSTFEKSILFCLKDNCKTLEEYVYIFFLFVGLNFVVYTFPVLALAMVGFVYLELKSRRELKR